MSLKYYTNGELTAVTDMLLKTAGGGGDYQEVDCTAAEYAAINPHDNHTIYVVTYPDGSTKKFLGDEEIGGGGEYSEVDCTAAEYETIDPHDNHTIYVVTYPDGSVKKFLGDDEIGEASTYYTVERAAIIIEEDAETMITEHEIINVDVVSGTTAVYGNANNKFIAGGHRVVMAGTNEQMANLLTREDIYGINTVFGDLTVSRLSITSISMTTDSSGNTIKRYTLQMGTNSSTVNLNVDIPSENVLTVIGVAIKVDSVSQTNMRCTGESGIAAIDNEGTKYYVPSGSWRLDATISMTTDEMNFALGMTERYEVVGT